MNSRIQVGRNAWRESRVGQVLNGKWRLLRLLGLGGRSEVYEAMHRNGRCAAVKIMTPTAAPTEQFATHEAQLAIAIGHPGVVEIFDDDVAEDGSQFLVMELLDGETLDEKRRAAGGQLPLNEALPLFEQILEVLSAAHERGIVHRDLKPENLFVTSDGRIKLLDFGLAAVGRAELDVAPPLGIGTPGYMSPEQARAEWGEVDEVSDLWAVAATMVTVLTGHLVHRGATAADLVRAAASEDVDLSALSATVPLRFVDVLQRALATDKSDRWHSARGMLAALRAAAMSESSRPASPTTHWTESGGRGFRLEKAVSGTQRAHRDDDVHRTILKDHADIRARLRGLADMVRGGLGPTVPISLRVLLNRFATFFAQHLAYEERELAPRIRMLEGWGPDREEALYARHREQRAELAAICRMADEVTGNETTRLATVVTNLIDSTLEDMLDEECWLARLVAGGRDTDIRMTA